MELSVIISPYLSIKLSIKVLSESLYFYNFLLLEIFKYIFIVHYELIFLFSLSNNKALRTELIKKSTNRYILINKNG